MYGSQFGKPCIQHKEETNKARLEIGLEILPDSMFVNCEKNDTDFNDRSRRLLTYKNN